MSLLTGKPQLIKYKLMGKKQPVDVIFYDGEVWLTQQQISDIYKLQLSTVNEHLKKITVANGKFPAERYQHRFRALGRDGKYYDVVHYRLEVAEELGKRTRKPAYNR